MHTGHFSSSGGGGSAQLLLDADPPDADPPECRPPPCRQTPYVGRPPWMQTPLGRPL